MPNLNNRFGTLLFALAAVAGIGLGACRQDDADQDEYEPSMEVLNSCEDYCRRAKLCDDDRDEQKCENTCIDAMTNCQVDEQGPALDKLDQCSSESCDDFFGCTVNVGAKCIFGIGS